uniref:Macro domain-containing protein n=1 Tax=viral metagenome TaxID=1070528 RepID=A0A6M3L1U0_9ZZZZ
MEEIFGDIWEHHKASRWVVITTNGEVRNDGACVMGRGVAKQAATKFPKLAYELGNKIASAGNNVYVFDDLKLITLPVKHHWKDKADLSLIERSLQQLVAWADTPPRKHGKFYIVRAGVGNGKLDWEKDVKPLFERYLDDRFVVVQN